jgi:hypothetical protein
MSPLGNALIEVTGHGELVTATVVEKGGERGRSFTASREHVAGAMALIARIEVQSDGTWIIKPAPEGRPSSSDHQSPR